MIKIPKPPKSSYDPDRPVSGLLKAQILHLQEVEQRLPQRHQSDIYINAIKTEGEAAEYIRHVTEALHAAHGVQPQGITRRGAIVRARRPVRGPDIAAQTVERPKVKRKNSVKKKAGTKRRR
ncbi:MAG TPA: hypothetical protein VIW68_14900 [Candidatus Sulfotelmatobacter sp.]